MNGVDDDDIGAEVSASRSPSSLNPQAMHGSTAPSRSDVRLREATQEDQSSMRRVMSPFRNRYFPCGLDDRRTCIAEIDGAIVGFVGWKGNEILALYVATEWRRRGEVGALLLEAAETAIGSACYRSVRIMTDADAGGAQRFYGKHDYVGDWNHGDEDVVWMTKRFA